MRASTRGGTPTHSAARHDWQDEEDEAPRRRIVRFPDRVAGRDPPGEENPETAPPRRRGRQAAPTADSPVRYILTAAGLFVAIGALAFLLLQLGQLGKQAPPSPGTITVSQPSQPTAPPPTALPATPPGQGALKVTSRVLEPSYTVVPGDTLNSIAARHGTTAEALQSINNLQDRNVLQVDQKLVLPNQP